MATSPPRGGKILYITYDGLADPLGRSQILPYLTGLSALGHEITVLSCEKPALRRRDGDAIAALCAKAGIDWQPLRYHKQPPILSGAYDADRLRRKAIALHRARGFDIVHCRSYMPAAAGLALKRRFGVPFLFDMRGLWPDERTESGSWPQSKRLYRAVRAYLKRLEASLLHEADRIISLTEAGERRLRAMAADAGGAAPVTVIPCCADFEHFRLIEPEDRAGGRAALGVSADVKVLAYLGSIGSWYMLDEMIDFFKAYAGRNPGAVFLVVTQGAPETIAAAAAARGVDPARLAVRAASRDEVPRLMAAADAGIFFIRPLPSKAASSPAKMGEMMALGLPIVTNDGVGDVSAIVAASRCGVIVGGFDEAAYGEALLRLDEETAAPAEIRAQGRRWYELAEGIRRYDGVYRALGAGRR